MGVQAELLKTAGGLAATAKAFVGDDKEDDKEEKKTPPEATTPKAPKQKSSPSPEQSKQAESPKVQALERALQRSQDSLKAALLQKQRRESADHLNLVNQLRRMKAEELAKREERK
jgi:hypothetical protein